MKNKNWSNEFPDVPERVHQTVLSTLAELDDGKGRRVKRMKKSKTVILIAAAVALMGITVSAAELFKWNKRAVEVFEADEELQQALVTEQIAEDGNQTVSGDGLTIQAIQTIQDNNCFYALFEVTAEDASMQITADHSMEFTMDYQEGGEPFAGLTWGFVPEYEQAVSNSRYFEIYGIKGNPTEEDLHMQITFTSLNAPAEKKAAEGECVLAGDWEFALNLHTEKPVCYELNKEYQIAGNAVLIKSVELTPISVKLVCDGEDARELEKQEGIDFSQTDSLTSLWLKGVKYQDGMIVEEEGCMEISVTVGEEAYETTVRLPRVIETEKVCALLVGQDRDEIVVP